MTCCRDDRSKTSISCICTNRLTCNSTATLYAASNTRMCWAAMPRPDPTAMVRMRWPWIRHRIHACAFREKVLSVVVLGITQSSNCKATYGMPRRTAYTRWTSIEYSSASSAPYTVHPIDLGHAGTSTSPVVDMFLRYCGLSCFDLALGRSLLKRRASRGRFGQRYRNEDR
jgi:hypothetical protein